MGKLSPIYKKMHAKVAQYFEKLTEQDGFTKEQLDRLKKDWSTVNEPKIVYLLAFILSLPTSQGTPKEPPISHYIISFLKGTLFYFEDNNSIFDNTKNQATPSYFQYHVSGVLIHSMYYGDTIIEEKHHTWLKLEKLSLDNPLNLFPYAVDFFQGCIPGPYGNPEEKPIIISQEQLNKAKQAIVQQYVDSLIEDNPQPILRFGNMEEIFAHIDTLLKLRFLINLKNPEHCLLAVGRFSEKEKNGKKEQNISSELFNQDFPFDKKEYSGYQFNSFLASSGYDNTMQRATQILFYGIKFCINKDVLDFFKTYFEKNLSQHQKMYTLLEKECHTIIRVASEIKESTPNYQLISNTKEKLNAAIEAVSGIDRYEDKFLYLATHYLALKSELIFANLVPCYQAKTFNSLTEFQEETREQLCAPASPLDNLPRTPELQGIKTATLITTCIAITTGILCLCFPQFILFIFAGGFLSALMVSMVALLANKVINTASDQEFLRTTRLTTSGCGIFSQKNTHNTNDTLQQNKLEKTSSETPDSILATS